MSTRKLRYINAVAITVIGLLGSGTSVAQDVIIDVQNNIHHIGSTYTVRPHASYTGALGTPSYLWRNIYVHDLYLNYQYKNSDIRLKENIKPLADSLNKILALTGYKFNYKPGVSADHAKVTYGLMAQEVEKVLPELVSETDDGQLKDRKYLEYDGVVPVLVEAIKEQQTLISEQAATINAMRSEICTAIPHLSFCNDNR